MSAKSDYLENALLNWVRGTAMPTPPTGLHVALYTAAPTDAGGGTEVTGNAYARTAVTFGAPSAGAMSNSGDVTFPTATPAGWGTVVAFGVFDAATLGNLLYWATITSKVVNANDQPKFAAGSLTVSEA